MTPDPIETLPDEVDEGERIFGAWYPPPTEEQVAAALQTDAPAAALVPEPDDTESWEKWAIGLLAAGATSVALDAAKSTAWLLVRRALLVSTLTDTTRRGVQAQIDLDPSPAAIVRAYGIPATRINTLAADPTRAAALLAERWRLVSDGETTATFIAGAIEAAAQAVANGTLPPGTEIEWNARYTSNICEECGYLDGQKQPPGSPWIGIYGDKYAGPGWHPGCRCGLTIIKGGPVKKISLTAPKGVVAELKRGLKWHEEGHSGDGLEPATVSWARRLADGEEITRDKAVKMSAWLARHKVDKEGQGYNPGEDGYPSPGRVAWALWGGDPAVGWSAKLVNYFEDDTVDKISKYYDPYKSAYDPPDLPTPCTPADLTPTMAVAMPPELQAEFCARWNALTTEIPAGAGMDDDYAYWCALDLCRQNGWMQNVDGSWAKIMVVGGTPENDAVEKAGKVLSAANHQTMHTNLMSMEKACANLRKMMDESGNDPIVDVPMGALDEEPVGKERVYVGFNITKVNPEKRQVSGFAYVAKDATGTPVTDHSGDVVDIPSILKVIHENFGKIAANDTHGEDVPATMIESTWIDHPILKSMGAIPDKSLPVEKQAPDGGWWTTWQISKAKDGDQLWGEVQSGEKTAFSIEGTGYRTPID